MRLDFDPVKLPVVRDTLNPAAGKARDERKSPERPVADQPAPVKKQSLPESGYEIAAKLHDLGRQLGRLTQLAGGLDGLTGDIHRMRELAIGAAGNIDATPRADYYRDEFAKLRVRVTTAGGALAPQLHDLGVVDSRAEGVADLVGGVPEGPGHADAIGGIDHALAGLTRLLEELSARGEQLAGRHGELVVMTRDDGGALRVELDGDDAAAASLAVRRGILGAPEAMAAAQAGGLKAAAQNLLDD